MKFVDEGDRWCYTQMFPMCVRFKCWKIFSSFPEISGMEVGSRTPWLYSRVRDLQRTREENDLYLRVWQTKAPYWSDSYCTELYLWQGSRGVQM